MQLEITMEQFLLNSMAHLITNREGFLSKIDKGEVNAIKLLLDSYFKFMTITKKEDIQNLKVMKTKLAAEVEEPEYENANDQFASTFQEDFPEYESMQ